MESKRNWPLQKESKGEQKQTNKEVGHSRKVGGRFNKQWSWQGLSLAATGRIDPHAAHQILQSEYRGLNWLQLPTSPDGLEGNEVKYMGMALANLAKWSGVCRGSKG